MKYFLIALAAWNLIVFLLYGFDKFKAKRNHRRISEATLLWSSFVMGALGAVFGMLTFHHKTQKARFKILVPIALILNTVVMVFIVAAVKGHIF